MDDQLQEIGARVKKARLDRGWTQGQLAEAVGISASFLSNIEVGRQAMNVRTLLAISNVLNVSADWLLNTETDSGARAVSEEIERELASCTPKERDTILRLVQLMKESRPTTSGNLQACTVTKASPVQRPEGVMVSTGW